jgi:putative membrane protein
MKLHGEGIESRNAEGRPPHRPDSGGCGDPLYESEVSYDNNSKRETSVDRLVYFAAERTLMAWLRAGLGLMALGFVVDRFSIVLGEVKPQGQESWQGDALSSWIGIALVLVGVAGNVTAAVRYLRFEIRYHRDTDTRPDHGLSLGIFFTLIISALGIIIVVFLIRTIE